jgi:hypothetical protein
LGSSLETLLPSNLNYRMSFPKAFIGNPHICHLPGILKIAERKSETNTLGKATTGAQIKFFVWNGPIILASDS